MKKCLKWNYKTHKYSEVLITDACFTHVQDLTLKIRCVNCSEPFVAGNMYTSHQYQNHMGFGYLICEECYQKEWNLRNKYKNTEDL